MPRPWLIDARDIALPEDLNLDQVLFTPAVDDYIGSRNSTKTVVAAPKGYGKTLLIKYKRRQLQDPSCLMIPNNIMVDVGPNAPPLSAETIGHISNNYDYWSTIWQVSIALSVIQHTHKWAMVVSSAEIGPHGLLRKLTDSTFAQAPFAIALELLSVSQSEFSSLMSSFNTLILPAFRDTHQQIAIFMDNIDECFEHHLTGRSLRDSHYGIVDKQCWYYAQIGLLMAIHRLRGQNPHVRVFAAIRSEAFNALKRTIPNAVNYLTVISFLHYSNSELRQIFEKNILWELKRRWIDANARDPWQKFFGKENQWLRHSYTGKFEHISDYIMRHTLGRPRDLMLLGDALAQIEPKDRDGDRVRAVVNKTASRIAELYLSELEPHLEWSDYGYLYPMVYGNVLDRRQIEEITVRYNRERPSKAWREVFRDLYCTGLIGHVAYDPGSGKIVQRFPLVEEAGEYIFDRPATLPESDHYLIHPVLGSRLHEAGVTFSENLDTRNIISAGAQWEPDDGMRFVVKGDVKDSSKIMRDPGLSYAFPQFFKRVIANCGSRLECCQVGGGDSLLIVDHNAYNILAAVQRVAQELRRSVFRVEMRFGMDWGNVAFVRDAGRSVPSAGLPLRRAARLEPLAREGMVLMTLAARMAVKGEVEDDEIKLLAPEDDFKIDRVGDQWYVGKRRYPREKDLVLDELYAMRIV